MRLGAPTRPYRSIEGCGNDVTSVSHGEAPTSKYGIVSHNCLPSPAGVLSQCEVLKARFSRVWGPPSTMEWRHVAEEKLARVVDGMFYYTDD